MTKNIRRSINMNNQVISMLKNLSEHYRLTENQIIELLFIISIDLDSQKSTSSKIKNHSNVITDKTTSKIYLRLSDDKYIEMLAVAKCYNLTLAKYLEALIISSYNSNKNSLIESVFS